VASNRASTKTRVTSPTTATSSILGARITFAQIGGLPRQSGNGGSRPRAANCQRLLTTRCGRRAMEKQTFPDFFA
jgi:hypothetical protein